MTQITGNGPHPLLEITRRHFFGECGIGVGKIALAGLLSGAWRTASAAERPAAGLAARPPHFPGTAKAVIQLFMAGAPSQLELFDHKPALAAMEGKPIPPEVIGGQRYAFIRPDAAVLGPRFRFARRGGCGAELSEMLPHLATVVDEIAIVKSCRTDQFNHAPAQLQLVERLPAERPRRHPVSERGAADSQRRPPGRGRRPAGGRHARADLGGQSPEHRSRRRSGDQDPDRRL